MFKSRASKDPGSPEILAKFEQARALSQQGQLLEAAALCASILEVQPDHVDAVVFCNRGAVLEQLNRFQEALASYGKAVSLNPAEVFAHYNGGTLLRRLGRMEDVLASFDREIAANPAYLEAQESAFEKIWERRWKGLPAEHIYV